MKHLGHQDYIEKLIRKVGGMYDSLEINIEYDGGEIDLLAHKGAKVDIFEVKCNGHKDRAIQQLQKAARKFKKEVRCTFFYDGERDMLEMI
jgi:Holliday junction resolvase-like predicted endonuclease